MRDCIFCQIVAGEAPASFVHRDELVSAFLDIRPVSPGHLLVIPKEHVVFSHDLPDAIADHLFAIARRLARTLRKTDAVRADGVNLFVAEGEAAGQEVFHAHLHVIPRFPEDGFEMDAAAWRKPPPTREELNTLATALTASEDPDERTRAWYRALPAKRIGAGVLFIDADGGVLLVRPTYKEHWEIPGGMVETGESPHEAAAREIVEELGIDRPMGRLLCVDWVPPRDPKTDGLMFLFDGGRLESDEVAAIVLRSEELSEHLFVNAGAVDDFLPSHMARRVIAALAARDAGVTQYLVDGKADNVLSGTSAP
jgi:8-oxo-dGTP diphosphatase